jgi:hypothetical protein
MYGSVHLDEPYHWPLTGRAILKPCSRPPTGDLRAYTRQVLTGARPKRYCHNEIVLLTYLKSGLVSENSAETSMEPSVLGRQLATRAVAVLYARPSGGAIALSLLDASASQ